MGKVFFAADYHFFHFGIVKHTDRTFTNIKEMHDSLIDSINSTVNAQDTLWVIGDFISRVSKEKALVLRERIKCRNVNLIVGNHDDPNVLKHVVQRVYYQKILKVNGQKIHLNHYPLVEWDNYYRDSWHLYGHCHSNKETFIEHILPNRLSLDVGIDNLLKLTGQYCPVSFEFLCEYFVNRSNPK